MTDIQQKDKKIAQLKSLLVQAKAKIQQYKAQFIQKQQNEQQLKNSLQKKIKTLQMQSQNIIKQYQQRLQRYQKSLEDSNLLIQKHQKGMINASKNYDQLIKKLATLQSITSRIFAIAPSKDKQNNEAVQQLCQIQKCKQYMEQIQKFSQVPDMEIVTSMFGLIVKNNQINLNKRRDLRIQTVKKQNNLNKTIQQQRHKQKLLQSQLQLLKNELVQVRQRFERNIQSMAKNKVRRQQQKTNQQFVKQLIIKLIMGPKQASIMAFGILAKVLKMQQQEIKMCQKKLK